MAHKNIYIFFIILSLIFGILAIIKVPPLVGSDEISHISRVKELSDGTILTKKMESANNFGGYMNKAYLELYYSNKDNINTNIDNSKNISVNDLNTTEISYSGSALYSPIAYIFHIPFMVIAKIFDISIFNTIYIMRFVSLISFTLIMLLAIYLIPYKKIFIFAIGLLPMSIQQASTISIDGTLIAVSSLLIATILLIKSKAIVKPISNKINIYFIILLLCSIYISMSKPVFMPIILLVPLILFKEIKNKYINLSTIIIIVCIPIIMGLAWNGVISYKNYHEGQKTSVNSVGIYPPTPKEGLIYILNPINSTKLMFNTFYIQKDSKNNDIPNYITQGFTGMFSEKKVTAPVWYSVSVFLVLLMAYYYKEKKKHTPINIQSRVIVIILISVILAGIIASMYFYTTTYKNPYINGVQGRYFIPLLPILLLLIGRKPLFIYQNNKLSNLLLISLIIFNLITYALLIILRF